MTEIEYRPIHGSNMEEADEHYKEIIQEANYSHYSCIAINHLQGPKHVHKNSTN